MAKRKRAVKGEGSWGKRVINGIEYYYYKKQYEGMSSPKTFYGRTQKEVKQKKEEFERSKGLLTEKALSQETLGEYMLNWLKTQKRFTVKKKTYDGYEEIFKFYIEPYPITQMQLSVINDELLQNYINTLAEKYSWNTIIKAYTLLNQCIKYASKKCHIAENYMSFVQMPSEDNVAVPKKEPKFLSKEDIDKLWEEHKRINEPGFSFGGKIGEPVYGNNKYAIIIIMETGIRVGELLALKWSDVDLEKKLLHIKTSYSRVKDRSGETNSKIANISSTKTKRSYRVIPLSQRAIYAFEKYAELNPNCTPDDHVIITANGTVPNARNITRTLNDMLVRANCSVKKCGLHALRHSFGSLLIKNGIDIKVVSEFLGHADITTTYNVYIHVLEEQKAEAINITDMLKGEKKEENKISNE